MNERTQPRRIVRACAHRLARWGHCSRIGGGVAMAAVLVAAMPGAGWAGNPVPHEVIWAQSSPGLVQDYFIFVSPVSGDTQSARRLEVGKPFVRTTGGVAMYSAIIEIDPTEYLAIGARGYNGASSLSSWSAAPPSRPGQPLLVEP